MIGVINSSGCLNGGGQIRPEKKEDMMTIADKLSVGNERKGMRDRDYM